MERKIRRRSPYRQNRRFQGALLSLLLAAVILFLNLANLFTANRDYSTQENRKLAQAPDFSLAALWDGSWFAGWEDYLADQFAWRDGWITMQLRFSQFLGNEESNGVYLCEDDYLMEGAVTPDAEHVRRNVDAVNAFATAHKDIKMYMAVIPNAVSVLSDKLPKNAPVRDQQQDLQALAKELKGVSFLNVTENLLSHKEEQLYYRTDHHWTSLGAKYAFESMAPAMGINWPIQKYQSHVLSTTFEGTLASKSGCHETRDKIEIFIPDSPVEYYVTYEDTMETVCSLYKRDCLKDKDQYTVFFGGNHPRVDICTTADSGRNLLLFKDSYANCFVQYLIPYFDNIIMIDPRYYYDNVENLVSRERITDVLFLYNANTYFEDTSLGDVLISE